MTDSSELTKLSKRLENKLIRCGVSIVRGKLVGETLRDVIADKLDGVVENFAELDGLLRRTQSIRRGETVSPPVASAAHVMLKEVCEALREPEEPRSIRVH